MDCTPTKLLGRYAVMQSSAKRLGVAFEKHFVLIPGAPVASGQFGAFGSCQGQVRVAGELGYLRGEFVEQGGGAQYHFGRGCCCGGGGCGSAGVGFWGWRASGCRARLAATGTYSR